MAGINKIELKQVTVEPDGQDTYCVMAYWSTQESPQKYTGTYHMEIKSADSSIASIDTETKIGRISNLSLNPTVLYSVIVTADGKSDDAVLLVDTYQNAKGTYDGTTLKLSWDAPSTYIGTGTCIVTVGEKRSYSYEISPFVQGMEIPMKESIYGQNMVLSVSLQPFTTSISSGPTVELEGIYQSRYIVTNMDDGSAQICYKYQSPDEKKIEIPLEGEIIGNQDKKTTDPVKSGPLELTVTAPYTLSISTDVCLSRTAYDNFISEICGLLTPKALYDILELITRCAFQKTDDSLYFHCGFRPAGSTSDDQKNQRCADIRPGFTLRVEQETYMPKEQLDGNDASGFIGSHMAEYTVSLEEGNNQQYLEFDSFISRMDETFYSAQGDEVSVKVGGGIIDLCDVQIRSSFYRIQYPDAFYSSDVEPDVYAQNHTLLVPVPGWQYDPQPENYFLFRGRSALTLLITIVVNGVEKKVPVGTTFSKLLHSMGISSFGKNGITWYRRSPFGKEVLMYFTGDIIGSMPLIHGDRIEG